MNKRLQFRHRPRRRPFGETEHGKHRGRPDNATATDVPSPQSAAAAVERQIDTGASRAVLASALQTRSRIGGVEPGRDEEERDRRGEQCHGHGRHVPPVGKVRRNRRGEDHPAVRRRQRPRDSEAVAAVIVDDPDDVGVVLLDRKRAFRAGLGPSLRRIDGDRLPVAVDQHRARQPFVGSGGQNPAKHFGRRDLRRRQKRGIELSGDDGRAHGDLMGRVPQGGIALDAQLLEGEKDRDRDRGHDAQRRHPRRPKPGGAALARNGRSSDSAGAHSPAGVVKARLGMRRARTRHGFFPDPRET